MNEISLDRLRIRNQAAIAPELLASSRVDTYMDDTLHRLMISIESEVLSHKVAESTYSMSIPYAVSFRWKHRTNWWMRPLLRLFPIEYETKEAVVTLSKENRFPESTMRYPDYLGKVVVVERGELQAVEPAIGGCGCPERSS